MRPSSLRAAMMNETRGVIFRFLTGRFLKSENHRQRHRIPEIGIEDERDGAPEGGLNNHGEAVRKLCAAPPVDVTRSQSSRYIRQWLACRRLKPVVNRDGQELFGHTPGGGKALAVERAADFGNLVDRRRVRDAQSQPPSL
jgi:hypothetical protein